MGEEANSEMTNAGPEEHFDPATIADFPPAEGYNITVIFTAGEEDAAASELARSTDDHTEVEQGGKRWIAARFGLDQADKLKRLNELLGKREEVIVLVDGKRVPFARTLWLPLSYIFTSSEQQENT